MQSFYDVNTGVLFIDNAGIKNQVNADINFDDGLLFQTPDLTDSDKWLRLFLDQDEQAHLQLVKVEKDNEFEYVDGCSVQSFLSKKL